jgi:hypothetical protein
MLLSIACGAMIESEVTSVDAAEGVVSAITVCGSRVTTAVKVGASIGVAALDLASDTQEVNIAPSMLPRSKCLPVRSFNILREHIS